MQEEAEAAVAVIKEKVEEQKCGVNVRAVCDVIWCVVCGGLTCSAGLTGWIGIKWWPTCASQAAKLFYVVFRNIIFVGNQLFVADVK